ncbi:MAG: FadR/GntR family transcriptional regulator [Sandaracinaceae bacterium]
MRTDRKADRVADVLLRGIVQGELEVGSLLPREAELAETHGVNRSVVREAIKLLEVHRLVRPIRRRGTEVLDPMASLSPEVLEAMLHPTPGDTDLEVLRDFLEVRSTLDTQMTVLVATRRTDADLAAFDAHLVTMEAALTDASRYRTLIDEMAVLFARATQNRIFQMLIWWNQEVARTMPEVFASARPVGPPHLAGLKLMIDLIRRQEAEQVQTLVAAYHEWATPRILAGAALRSGASLDDVLGRL